MKDVVTYISRDVHRKFFHQFVKFGAKVLYPMYVSVPQTEEELRDCENEYAIAGFPGCIGSTDATLKGAYVIVDNGYLEWSTTVPPMKASCNRSELRFSQWLESMRKDVECTFGILKGRWQNLKTGIRVHNTEVSDHIWLTCRVLHNMLLDVDGLSKAWKSGTKCHWELESGEFRDDEIPFAVRRLVDPTGTENFRLRQYDGSRFGYIRPTVVSDNEDEDEDDSDDERNETANRNRNQIRDQRTAGPIGLERIESGTAVNELNMFQFRSLLVENFNIRFHENDIQWPKRLGAPASPRNVPVLIPAT